jgi:hypothetical protein
VRQATLGSTTNICHISNDCVREAMHARPLVNFVLSVRKRSNLTCWAHNALSLGTLLSWQDDTPVGLRQLLSSRVGKIIYLRHAWPIQCHNSDCAKDSFHNAMEKLLWISSTNRDPRGRIKVIPPHTEQSPMSIRSFYS